MRGKFLLSVAAATLIVTGFTGCDVGKSEDTTTSAVVNPVEQTQYATTIKGVVLDDAGNPVANAKVYIGSKEATTNAGGQYEISGVDVSGYVTIKNGQPAVVSNVANPITVTILPPADSDMVSAVVTVTPQMIHVENGGVLDGSNVTTTGDINTQPESQSFTILAETQRAVLPHKAAKIEATVRDARTGQPVPAGTKVTAIWKSLSTNAVAVNQNETVGVNSVVGYVDENGTVKLEGLLTSSNYNFIVEGYAVNNTNVEAQGDTTGANVDGTLKGLSFNTLNVTNYADKDYITDLGNILVTPINGEDTIAPTLAFDSNAAGIGGNIFAYLNVPLEDGTTVGMVYAPGIDGSADNPLIVNFTEPLQNDITANDVIVYDVTNKRVIPVSQVNLTNGGQTLEIVTAEPIAPNTQIQIRLNRATFKDLADNILVDSPQQSDIYTGPNNSYVALNASTYFQVNMNLSDITDLREDNATAIDFTGNGYNNKALSTVADVTPGTIPTTLYQMNDNANAASLSALATAVNGGTAVTVNTNYARVSFTPDANVSDYYAVLVDQNDNPVTTATIYEEDAVTALPAAPTGAGYFKLTDANGVLHNSFIVSDAALASGYKVKVYPVNEFGDLGNPATITLQDNIPLTTVLNNVNGAVDLLGATTGGNTGDLVDIQNASGTGLPILKVIPEMLKTSASASNSDLQTTLTGTDGIYDANDYANFNKARTIGISISEPVSSDDVITDYLKVLENNGSVVDNYVNSAQFVDLGGNNYAIAFGVNNIIDLQKYAKVTIEGIHDRAGNVADAMAADKIVDGLPPMVVSATATKTQLEIDFTEPISLTDSTGAGYTFTLDDNTGTVYTFTTTSNGTISVVRNTTYTDEYGNTVTAADPAIELNVVSDGSSDGKLILQLPTDYTNTAGNTVDLSSYFELIHGKKDSNGVDNAVAPGASILAYANVNDVAKNSWASVATTLTTLPDKFAVADNIAPKVAAGTQPINPLATDKLYLAITDNTGATINTAATNTDGDSNWEVGDTTGNFLVRVKFREPIADSTNTLFNPDATYEVIPANSTDTYKIISTSKINVIDQYTIEVSFSKDSTTTGAVAAGDTLKINGIKDANGNETNVTITLNAAGQGITVNTEAYK